MEQDNQAQISAERIQDAITALYDECDADPETLIGYALCDLRHLCDRLGVSFGQADQAGHKHYLEDLKG